MVGDFSGRAGHENLAAVQDVRAIGDGQRLAHVVVRDEDADAPGRAAGPRMSWMSAMAIGFDAR